MNVGIDFGTSNSSVAIFDGQETRLVALDPAARNPAVMRTLLYLPREGGRIAGHGALDTFYAKNTGRSVKLKKVQIGVLQNTFAEIGTTYTDVFVWVDENEPGRLFRSLKAALPDKDYLGTSVYGMPYSLEDLIAAFLMELRERVERELGGPVERAVVGRPVHYSADPDADALAAGRMLAACELAGLNVVQLLEEPVAAALSYGNAMSTMQRVLVFDFGGGTLDLTVMVLEPGGRHQVLATGGTPIGGDVLDRQIMRHKLLRQFGSEAVVGPKRLTLPARVAELLTSWQTIGQLNEPSNKPIMEMLRNNTHGATGRKFQALECLVTRNYGLPLFEAIEQAKVRLSELDETIIDFIAEAILLHEPITRFAFEAAIATELHAIGTYIDDTVAASGLQLDQIDMVIRTGGSSAIPAFIRLLSDRFGPEKVAEHQVFTGVTRGLAIAAAGAAIPTRQ